MYKNEYERWLAFDLDDPDLKPELESVKDDDEAIKDRTAGIELDAHCRAQAVEAAAQVQVEKTKREVEQWIAKVQESYDRMRSDIDATISHASGELERVRHSTSCSKNMGMKWK